MGTDAMPSVDVSRHADRQGDWAAARAILAEGMVAHLGFIRDGWPVVLPFHYGIGDLGDGRGEQMIVHGSTGGRAFLDAARGEPGVPVSVCVSFNDALVLGRSQYATGARYRSVVAFGHARLVPPESEQLALDILMDHIIPGRRDEVRPPTRKEVAQTALLAIPLDHASVKVAGTATGEDSDDGEDRAIWAGILPLRTVAGAPVASPETLNPDNVPKSVRSFLAAHDGNFPVAPQPRSRKLGGDLS